MTGEELILSKETPLDTARKYVDDRHRDSAGRLTLRHWAGCWYRWDGGCYHEATEDEFRPHLWEYLDSAKRYGKPDRDGKQQLTTFKPKRNDVAELEAAVQGLRAVKVPAAVELPSWIGDRDSEPAGPLIPLENGLLSVPNYLSGKGEVVLPHSPDYFALHQIPLAYDPSATCPAWDRFLDEVFEGDRERVDALHEWIGYNLTAETRYQKLMVLYGVPRSGKSTVARIMTALIGGRNVANPTLRDLSDTYGLWGLHGKLAAIVGDGSNVRDAMPLVERLKGIVGEDTVTVQRKYLPPIECRLNNRFTIIMNDLPRFPDASAAIMRRVLLIPFNRSFADLEDFGLEAKLKAELPGILNRCLQGLRRLHERGGFVQCAAGRPALAEMERMTGGVKAFAMTCCRMGEGLQVSKADLVTCYRKWCQMEERKPAGESPFFRALYTAFPDLKDERHQPRAGGKRVSVWVVKGVALADEWAESVYQEYEHDRTGRRIVNETREHEADMPGVAA